MCNRIFLLHELIPSYPLELDQEITFRGRCNALPEIPPNEGLPQASDSLRVDHQAQFVHTCAWSSYPSSYLDLFSRQQIDQPQHVLLDLPPFQHLEVPHDQLISGNP